MPTEKANSDSHEKDEEINPKTSAPRMKNPDREVGPGYSRGVIAFHSTLLSSAGETGDYRSAAKPQSSYGVEPMTHPLTQAVQTL
jgi:hypothetical protein